MNTFGAALATVISQGFSFLLGFICLYKMKDEIGLEIKLKKFRMKWAYLKPSIFLGTPQWRLDQYPSIFPCFLLIPGSIPTGPHLSHFSDREQDRYGWELICERNHHVIEFADRPEYRSEKIFASTTDYSRFYFH